MVRYRATVIIDFPHMATRELAVLPILRDEACGARIAGLRGRRLRPAPQVILTFRLGIIELTLASALDFSYL